MADIRFRALRQDEIAADTDLDDLVTGDRSVFEGSEHRAFWTDTDGDKLDDYPKGQKVQFQATKNDGSSWFNVTEGWIAKPDELDEAPLAVRAKLFDLGHFLRKNYTDRSFSDQTISSILESIIKNDTPVGWDASKVTVDNDVSLTIDFSNERVIDAIDRLRRESNDEDPDVDINFDFTFSSSSGSTVDEINDTSYIRYSLPKTADRMLNEVTATIEGGKEVTSSNTTSQNNLKSELGAPRNVTLTDQISAPQASTTSQGQAIADEWQEQNEGGVRGTVTVPLSRFNATPGDNVRINISEKNINQSFNVAGVSHHWGRFETTFEIGQANSPLKDMLNRGKRGLDRATSSLTSRGLNWLIGV